MRIVPEGLKSTCLALITESDKPGETVSMFTLVGSVGDTPRWGGRL